MKQRVHFSWLIAALVIVMVLTLVPAQGTSFSQGPGDTLTRLENTIIPPRDRVDLARRLRGITDIPAPPTQAPPELELGAVATFTAENLEEDYTFTLDAELVYKTEHVYMFVEVGQPVDRQGIQRSAEAFENVIRPKVNEVFGMEWFPGIDGDPHITILHSTRLGFFVAAYYGSQSQYPKAVEPKSNEREMFFVNLDSIGDTIGTEYYESVLAHEFQHMVHWKLDENEDSWLNEGLSELATLITGYGSSGFAPGFLSAPNIQLTHWPEDDSLRPDHYGAAYLFAAYFYQRYGESATTTLVNDAANGMESVQRTLTAINAADPSTGAPVNAVDLFADWLVTNLLMDASVGDGRYAYTLDDLSSSLFPAAITDGLDPDGQPVTLQAPQWGAHYLQVYANPSKARLTFKGNDTVQVVPTDAHSGQYMWWSNRADVSNMRLTRAFDLSGVSSAMLNFWTWYFIEDGWDYGYVMVSTDGGATWTPLSTDRTTTDDPHGNSYGSAYTGESGGWVQESIDLTPYAGQNILLRFEYMTDDAVTQPGMVIDDVSIPEIGYADDFESGEGGWTPEGWVWIDNVLPQRFLLMVVQPGNSDAPVTRLLDMNDQPQGEWEIDVDPNTVIIVSGLTPVTTEPADYTVVLAPVP
jgi:hypothetical protein